MSPIKTIILDDEQDSVKLLQLQLARHCPQVEVTGAYTSPVRALHDIETLEPDLLLLDINMPGLNGFEFLNKLMPINFNVIFITAYNQHALKAFRFNAIDYLVKPVDSIELTEAVAKAERKVRLTTDHINNAQRLMRGEAVTKIAIPSQNGISFISLDEIVFAEASNNYSKLILADGRNFVLSKTLKDVQEVLEESHFLRIHRQYIINLNHVKHFNRNGSMLTMDNKAELPVARNQKDKLIQKYGWL